MTDSSKTWLIYCPEPFSVKSIVQEIEHGKTIAELVDSIKPSLNFELSAIVYCNDELITEDRWGDIVSQQGDRITIRIIPMGGGGGGKSPLRTVLSLALMAAAPYAGLQIGAALGIGFQAGSSFAVTAFGQFVGSSIFSIAGSLALNAIAPPSKPRSGAISQVQTAEKTTQYIAGSRNQLLPFGTIPKPLGTHRMIPPFGARPYTETIGNDQYVRMLYVWGYGPMSISDLKIGETPITDFTDVEIETKQGFPADTPLTTYTNTVIQNDLNIALTQVAGYQTRTTENNIDEISVDITFARGLTKFNTNGSRSPLTITFDVQYAVAGSGIWVDVATQPAITITADTTASLRRALRWTVAAGQYDVRIRRNTVDSVDTNTFDAVSWTALRSVRNTNPINMSGIACTVLRIKATDQLNGVVDQLNGVVTSLIKDWNGASWVADTASSNPASIFREIMQGNANARPIADSRLNLTDLQTWHANCAAAGRQFNYVVDTRRSIGDLLQDVAAAGRASVSQIDGKWTIIEDKVQTVPIQEFTPRNTYNFASQKAFADLPHAIKINFINKNSGYQPDQRIVYDDGYDANNATKFETLDLVGITDPDQVYKDGRYHIASARLRPEMYRFNTDIEHIACTRGDLIRMNHDVMLVGLGYARIKSINSSGGLAQSIVIDDIFTMSDHKTYQVRIRTNTGTRLETIATVVGDQSTISFVTPFTSTLIQVGNLVSFGEAGSESAEYIVKSIRPTANMTAEIICVDASPAIHSADTGTIPAFSSSITMPEELQQPPTPILVQVQTGEEALIVNADGGIVNAAIITLEPPKYSRYLEPIVYQKGSTENVWTESVITTTNNTITVLNMVAGTYYDFKIIYKNQNGIYSKPLYIYNQIISGADAPDDVTNFNVNILSGTAYLSWDLVVGKTISHYQIKYNALTTGATWANSFILVDKISAAQNTITVPALTGTYLIKAITASGVYSTNETLIVSTIGDILGLNAVASLPQHSTFVGDKTNCSVSAGSLILTSPTTGGDGGSILGSGTYVFAIDGFMDTWLNVDNVPNFDTFTEPAVDLGAIYTSTLSADVTSIGVDTTAYVDDWGNVDAIEDWDGTAPPSSWSIKLQVRTTTDDPAATPVWTAWRDFIIGEYTARAFQFRMILYSYTTGITPSISALTALIDMPDRTTKGDNISALSTDATGTQITFLKPFRATPAIVITGQTMSTGDYWELSDQNALGFKIKFFNSVGTRITKTFDYNAVGYGEGA